MFICNSYMKRPKVIIRDLNKGLENYFIHICKTDEMNRIKKDIDLDYLEGVIYLKYFDNIIMDFRYWDLVDQLWAYILDMIEEFLVNGTAETYFPDQPILLSFKSISKDYMLLSIDGNVKKSWTLPKQEFLNTLIVSAEEFFTEMTKIFSSDVQYGLEFEKIKRLKTSINNG
ncbi:hypothetical protein WAZ07_21775 [Bacillus sp. FJAT-51639]|uniref:Uncharacterized protein n=1 Tax=Bacillus bruguierae TaxID=3127667 RepID=A0ABU8FM90_9BACI